MAMKMKELWKRFGWRVIWLVTVLALLSLPFVKANAVKATAAEHIVHIEASQYRFDPGVVRVDRGDTVTIELAATDVVHGLYLDGYDLQLTADPGQPARLTFVADRAGTFRFRCSVSCGAMHPFMIGKLQVGSNSLFWTGMVLALLATAAALTLPRRTVS